MRSIAVAVPKEKAEEVRQTLLAMGLLRKGVAPDREADTVYLPVTMSVAVGYPNVEREFREAFTPIRSYKDVARVPPNFKSMLPTSFDTVGDIAILKIPEELAPFETEIANAILRAHTNMKVVAADAGVKGPLRVRQLRILAGPDRTETVHREFGLSYNVDVARAYFSPRLGSERLRIANQVADGEIVVDMFSGVGPYAILIAKRREPRIVHAFDANPDAFRYLGENVRRNRADRVEPKLGDAIELLATVEPPHRIIIDYPQDPNPAYRAALARIVPGGVVHYYAFLEAVEREDREHELLNIAESFGRGAEVVGWRDVHGWSPTQKLYAFDVNVT
ncbi:MAG: class I SAM-dependent methyltransferase family protein [Euryarchaeota archaeon]|nr:class I SAM-dependent methyltransferase family protein [Euryarchaeota archaeon]